MLRVIPPRVKTKFTFFKNFTFLDLAIVLVTFGIIAITLNVGLPVIPKLVIAVIVLVIGLLLVMEFGDFKLYEFIFRLGQFSVRNKDIPETNIKDTGIYIEDDFFFFEIYGKICTVVELTGINLEIYSEHDQDKKIFKLSKLLQTLSNCKIIRMDATIFYDDKIKEIDEKIKDLNNKTDHMQRSILLNQRNILNNLNDYQTHKKDGYFIVNYFDDIEIATEKTNHLYSELNDIGLDAEILAGNQIKYFFAEYYEAEMDEEGWFNIPSVRETSSSLLVNDVEYQMATFKTLPSFVGNAWLSELFSIPGTKVSVGINTNINKAKTLKAIDKSILELSARLLGRVTESEKDKLEQSINSLKNLVTSINLDQELIHQMEFTLLFPIEMKKRIKEVFQTIGMKPYYLKFEQLSSYLSATPLFYEVQEKNKNVFDINTTSLAASFPFTSRMFNDTNGYYIGSDKYPVFFNLFGAWDGVVPKTRINSNMAIMGSSGSGKSYFTKLLLLQEILNGTKVFVLDPENEYKHLTEKLKGNWVDVAGLQQGRINPLQIFPILETDDDEFGNVGILQNHLSFLQEWFKVVLPMEEDMAIQLRKCLRKLYKKFGISDDIDINSLDANKFPLFQDLHEVVTEEHKRTKDENDDYEMLLLRKLKDSLLDFIDDGAHAPTWNNYTTLKIDNDFTVFNFQELIANTNMVSISGQMLLYMKFLMKEAIKNKNYNEKNGTKNKIIIAVDEAHQFISTKYPVALTFMKDMAKRIRKYGGSLIVTTQQIKDFIGFGDGEALKDATGVINNCQYHVLFNPAKDKDAITKMYESMKGGLTERELEFLEDAKTGESLLLIDPATRLQVNIQTYPGEQDIIERI